MAQGLATKVLRAQGEQPVLCQGVCVLLPSVLGVQYRRGVRCCLGILNATVTAVLVFYMPRYSLSFCKLYCCTLLDSTLPRCNFLFFTVLVSVLLNGVLESHTPHDIPLLLVLAKLPPDNNIH